jgi:hypothetical protein
MKKILLTGLGLALCSTLLHAKDSSKSAKSADSAKRADFSGNWVLSAGESSNLPAGLDAYSMLVTEDDQQLKVETTLKGDLRPMEMPYPGGGPGGGPGNGGPGNYPGSPTGYPGGVGMGMPMPGRGGMGMPGGGSRGPMGEGMPGGGMPGGGGGGGRSRGQSRSQAEIAALRLYPPTATYKLDGSESTAALGGPDGSDATLKADWAKNGQELKLSATGSEESGQRTGEVQVKDQWKLSKDGQSLMVDRSVRSPEGSGTVHLVFRKQATEPGSSSAPPK